MKFKFRHLSVFLAFTIQSATAETLSGGIEVNEALPPVKLQVLEAKVDKQAQALPKQDCVCFDNARCHVENINGQWKIVDGNNWIMDFASRQDLAELSLGIIRHYRLNNICFVGRPFSESKIKMMYFLSDGQAPAGDYAGEDAIAFDPARVKAEEIDGRWKLTQDSMWMLDFAANKEDALKAEEIVKYYGFTRQCFVGRPGPPMMYWRK
ncbi:MAG: hypothetical protein K2W82_04285 [Candidatus Obscuribacterales bacterium]|nr:hypothetical protein [Candidatus Obscuribacterales bacterium]